MRVCMSRSARIGLSNPSIPWKDYMRRLQERIVPEKKAMEVAKRLFFQGKDNVGAKVGRIIGAG